ncbi:MAG: sulfatase activating formylglycine-generating enzyme [Planctomycetota bacterium]|jgi:formylglycine-generating enzyme required for sulfatase activity
MRFALAIVIWASVCMIAPAQGGIGVADAKTLAKIRAQEAVVGQKENGLVSANRLLQDDYQRLHQLFDETRSGANKAALMDLVRVLEEPIELVNASMRAGRQGTKLKREFMKSAAKAPDKVEHELLKTLKAELKKSIEAAFNAKIEAKVKEIEIIDFGRSVVNELLPKDMPFWEHWNKTILGKMKNRESYVAAFDNLSKSEAALMVLKDPKMKFTVGAPEGMAKIPGGKISIESTYGFSEKKRKANYKSFYIDVKEVTHGDYWSKFWVHLKDKEVKASLIPIFADSRGRDQKQWVQDPETGEYAPHKERMNWPVTGVDAKAAQAYAASQGKRLPTEAEWLAAATGTPGKTSEYPWGQEWVPECSNDAKTKSKTPKDVGSFPRGRSFYGLFDVSGNAKEWLNTLVNGKNAGELKPGLILVVRGGSFESSASGISLKWRWQMPALGTRKFDVGFRCAQEIEK